MDVKKGPRKAVLTEPTRMQTDRATYTDIEAHVYGSAEVYGIPL